MLIAPQEGKGAPISQIQSALIIESYGDESL